MSLTVQPSSPLWHCPGTEFRRAFSVLLGLNDAVQGRSSAANRLDGSLCRARTVEMGCAGSFVVEAASEGRTAASRRVSHGITITIKSGSLVQEHFDDFPLETMLVV